jgi:hypothetical protein
MIIDFKKEIDGLNYTTKKIFEKEHKKIEDQCNMIQAELNKQENNIYERL